MALIESNHMKPPSSRSPSKKRARCSDGIHPGISKKPSSARLPGIISDTLPKTQTCLPFLRARSTTMPKQRRFTGNPGVLKFEPWASSPELFRHAGHQEELFPEEAPCQRQGQVEGLRTE